MLSVGPTVSCISGPSWLSPEHTAPVSVARASPIGESPDAGVTPQHEEEGRGDLVLRSRQDRRQAGLVLSLPCVFQGNSLLCMPNVLKLYLENGQTRAFKYEADTTVKVLRVNLNLLPSKTLLAPRTPGILPCGCLGGLTTTIV